MTDLAEFFKALADETRLKILEMVSQKDMCVCEIIENFGLSQPAVSHHLKILRQAGLVNSSKKGRWIYYSINEEILTRSRDSFNSFFTEKIAANLFQERLPADFAACLRIEKAQVKKGVQSDENLG